MRAVAMRVSSKANPFNRKYLSRRSHLSAAVGVGVLSLVTQIHASTFYWDGDGTGAVGNPPTSGVGGAGQWDNSITSHWWDGTAYQIWDAAAGQDIADFRGTAGTVTINSGETENANQIIFNTAGYLITGDSSTSIGLTGSGTLTSNSGLSTIATAISGGTLNVTGTGTVSLTGVTSFGNVTINAGSTLRTAAASFGAAGTILGSSETLNGGTLLYYVPNQGSATSYGTVGTYSANVTVAANSTLQFDQPIGNGASTYDYGSISLGANLSVDAQTFSPDFTYGMPVVNSLGGLTLTNNATLNVSGINANATSQIATFHELSGLTGAFTLTKAGNGTAIIGAGSSYSGLNASAGLITFADAGGFPTSTLLLSGGSVLMNLTSTSVIANSTPTTVSGNSTLSLDQPGNSGAASINTGPLSIGAQTLTLSTPYPQDYFFGAPVFNFSSTSLSGNPTFNVSGINATSSLAFTPSLGAVTGATNTITKTGNAILAIGAGSNYAGLSINAGSVSLSAATAFPTASIAINNGGGLTLGATTGTTVTNTTAVITTAGNAAITLTQTAANGGAIYNLGTLNMPGGMLTVSTVTANYFFGQPSLNFGTINLTGNEFYSENGGIPGNNLMTTALGPINGSSGSFTFTKTGNANVSILPTAVPGATSYYGLAANGGSLTLSDLSGFPTGALTLGGGTLGLNMNAGTSVTTSPTLAVTLPSKVNINQNLSTFGASGFATYNFGTGTIAANLAIALPTPGDYYFGAPAVNVGATTLTANSTISVTGIGGGSSTLTPTFASLTGSATLTKNGPANLTIKAAAATPFTGSAIVNSGILQINAATALGTGTGNVTVNASGAYAAGYAIDSTFLSHVTSSSTGVIALAAASTNNLDFSSAGGNFPNASLGAVGTVTYSGTLTPNGTTYRLGGGGGTLTYSSALAAGNSLVVGGALGGTITLSNAANAFTGNTTVNSGTLNVTGSLPATSALTFGSTGAFNETGAATGSSQSLGALSFGAGQDTLTSTYGTSGNTSLTFASLSARSAGATGNFVVTNGTNGTTNKITLTGQTTGVIDQGTFFGGTNYAYYDAGGFVRGISYTGTVDAGAVTSGAATTVAGTYVQTTGAISAETTNTFTTLNISGANNFTLASAATVTTNGILKSGANSATISGGTSIKPGAGAELVLRADASGDTLVISTPIVANGSNALTKSGLGTVTLSGVASYTGATTIDSGTLKLGIANALPAATTLTFAGGAAASTLDLGGFAQTLSTNLAIAPGSVPVNQTITDSGNAAALTLTSAQTFSGTIQGTAGINFNNSGTLVLSGPNNVYTGGTTVTQGTIQLGATNALGNGLLTIGSSGQSATVDLNGFTQSVTGLITPSGTTSSIVTNTSATPATLITANSGSNSSFTGVIQDGASKVSLIVNGSNTTLGGANTYSGNTTLLGGQLTLAAAGSIANTPLINISGGILNVAAQSAFAISASQTLRGMGSVVGKVTVNGTLATGPTSNIAGKSASYLTLGNSSVLAGSTLMDLTAINAADEIFVSGAGGITLGGSLTVTNPNSIAFAAGQVYSLFSFTTETGTFSTTTLPTLGSSLAWNTAGLYTAGTISVVSTGPANLTFNNAGGIGDGVTWNTTQQNFNSGSAVTAFSNGSGTGDNVTFSDVNNGHYNVSIPAAVTPSSTVVSATGNYNFSGAGGIGGTGGLTKSLSGSLTISVSNSYTGATNVSGGSVILAAAGALPTNTALKIATGAKVLSNNLGATFVVASLNNSGLLDLANNKLVVHAGSVGTLSTQAGLGFNNGAWNGSTGIISAAASADTLHLTALGVIQNSNNGSPSGTALYSSFGSATGLTSTDVLVKYTYYGDTNLDGKVDGSDYGRIDSAYVTPGSTGWFNGDFNYDGVINGSDYTLIDNAFNTQGALIASQVASPFAVPTAQIAGSSAVPEPTSFGLLSLGAIGLLGRRSRKGSK